MKPISMNLRICALLMTALILFQSCVVYHKTPVSFDDAVQANTKSKVVTSDGETAVYNHILLEDSQYFGVNRKNGVHLKTRIENDRNLEVYLKNKSKSNWATLGLIVAPPAVGFLLFGILIPTGTFLAGGGY
ncbi:hypothetical protein [Robiginitalea sp. SC105]|uniref:hypothetical protein n=1 Tax=Robiginitalea sp. SC105 TaxID=2762332 RepID=UPI00163B39E4|nr:hypothetical protein [Robiginitalea sp. SC105]MBC2839865.1 hypothetical protein [Robiginitalea sp. SC105]